jgi:hypothetical protein
MRTSFDLDDDLADKLKRLAAKQGVSLRRVLNDVLRRGLSKQSVKATRKKPYRTDTFRSAFRPGVDAMKLNQLVDELDARAARDRS